MAQSPLGNAFGLASLYDPQIAVDQAALDRQMQIAQALRAQGMQSLEPSKASVGGMAYKISPFEGLAKIAQTYTGTKLDQQNDQQRLALALRMQGAYAPLFDPGSGPSMTQGDAQQTLAAPQPSANPLDTGSTAGPTVANQASAVPTGAPTKPAGLYGNIPGVSPQQAMAIAMTGGFEPLNKAVLDNAALTPDAKNAVMARGGDLGKARADMLAKVLKDQALEARPGSTTLGFNADGTVTPKFYNPSFAQGVVPQWNANGQVTGASEAPGYAAANADIAGQKSMAESAAGVHMVKMADGREVPMRIPAPGASAAAPTSPGGAMAAAVRSTAPTDAASNPSDPWSTLPMLAQPQGIGQTTGQAEDAKLQAQYKATQAKEYQEAAKVAASRKATNLQALDLVDRADTGPLAAQKAEVKNFLTSQFPTYFKESDFENTPSATIVLGKDLMNAAIGRAREVFNNPRMTQQEVMQYLGKGAPNVDMPKEAIKFLLNTDNAMADYQVNKANDFGKAMAAGGDPQRFEGWYSKTFPPYSAIAGFKLPEGKQPKGTTPTSAAPSAGPSVVRTGVYQGRRVEQLSDGTTRYAN